MARLTKARVEIEGTRSLLWNHCTPEALAVGRREKRGTAGNDPEEWQRTVLRTQDGQLYLLPTSVFGCLRDAGRHTKRGRQSLQRLVAATLQVVDEQILVDRAIPQGDVTTDPTAPVYLDVRPVRNPATKGTNIRYRIAASKGWRCAFCIAWDPTIVSCNEMEAVLQDAGVLVGLGDARSIGMGRFTITSFAVLDDESGPPRSGG